MNKAINMDRALLQEVTQALGDLSFESFAVFGTCAPTPQTYNRTFGVLEKARAYLTANNQVAIVPESDVLMRLRSVIAEVCDDMSPREIDLAHQLQEHLGFDSFERVELLNAIEDEFEITVPPGRDRELSTPQTTVADLLAAVEQLISAKGQPA